MGDGLGDGFNKIFSFILDITFTENFMIYGSKSKYYYSKEKD